MKKLAYLIIMLCILGLQCSGGFGSDSQNAAGIGIDLFESDSTSSD